MACDHGMMLMSDHDDAYVDAMLMVNMQANTRSVTLHSSGCGGNEGWRVHEAIPGDEVCEGVSARF